MVVMRRNDSLPEIKQLSGPGNALGKVKFLFPNSYDIYLHDTEAKELFLDKKRAFSHGCIRLEDAEAMSGYVLRDNSAWTANKIRSAMNGSKPQSVAVKNPIPVVITYFTAWVDAHGQLQFRNDVYQQDKRTAAMMFAAVK
jgi:murein L,D-transpeptidase YcbB/YkuD